MRRKHSETSGLQVLAEYAETGRPPSGDNGQPDERDTLIQLLRNLDRRLKAVETMLNIAPTQPVAND